MEDYSGTFFVRTLCVGRGVKQGFLSLSVVQVIPLEFRGVELGGNHAQHKAESLLVSINIEN